MDERPVYSLEASDVVKRLQSDPELGLRDQEAADRLRQFGENRLAVAALD